MNIRSAIFLLLIITAYSKVFSSEENCMAIYSTLGTSLIAIFTSISACIIEKSKERDINFIIGDGHEDENTFLFSIDRVEKLKKARNVARGCFLFSSLIATGSIVGILMANVETCFN